jgi:uncharacterized protein (DUF58 family)
LCGALPQARVFSKYRRGTVLAVISGAGEKRRHDMFDASAVGRVFFIAWMFLPAVVLLVAMVLLDRRPAIRVRRLWCRTAGREVELTVVANTVRACTAFEPVGAITCGRACPDPTDRQRWPARAA